MKKLTITNFFLVLSAFFMMFLFTPVTASASTVNVKVTTTYKYDEAYRVLSIVNQERRANGLSTLKMDKSLLKAAMKRGAEITYFYSHTRPNGKDCFSISPLSYGENIAVGQKNSTIVMNSWMNSPGHRTNILDPRFKCMGVGCVYYNGTYYWTQVFGINNTTSASKLNNSKVTDSINIKYKSSLFSPENVFSKTQVPGKSITIKLQKNNSGWEYNNFIPKATSFTWKSSNKNIASISSAGVLKTLKTGKTTITAYYKGTTKKAYSVTITVKKDVAKSKLTMKTSYSYSGKAIKPSVILNYGTKKLTNGTDYTVTYSSNTNAGKGLVTISGKGSYAGKIKKEFIINPVNISKVTVKFNPCNYRHIDDLFDIIYNNTKVYFNGKLLKKDTDYRIAGAGYNAQSKQIKSMVLQLLGNYTGTQKVYPSN